MATTRTRTARKSATLLGIEDARGDHCQDCDRELTARLFRVRVTATGEIRHLGRKCAALATGYPTTRLEHEARHAAQLEAMNQEHAAMTLADYLAFAATIDLTTGQEFIDFHTARHAELVARYAV
jgi:hypothetical protein